MNLGKINRLAIVTIFVGGMILVVYAAKTTIASDFKAKKETGKEELHSSTTEFIFFEAISHRMLITVYK